MTTKLLKPEEFDRLMEIPYVHSIADSYVDRVHYETQCHYDNMKPEIPKVFVSIVHVYRDVSATGEGQDDMREMIDRYTPSFAAYYQHDTVEDVRRFHAAHMLTIEEV